MTALTRLPGVAAFDFDGTLVAGDSLGPFLARVHGPVGAGWLLMRSSAPMARAYRKGGRDAAKARLVSRAMGGRHADEVADHGRLYGESLARRVRPRMSERLQWHAGQGHRLVLVSASLAVYLEPFARLAGFHEVIATRLEVGPEGRLTGELDGANVRGEEKARRLRELFGGPVELWAYGDSAGDRHMLELADHAFLVGRGGSTSPRVG